MPPKTLGIVAAAWAAVVMTSPASAQGGQYGTPVLVVNVTTTDGRPVEDALVRIREAGRVARTNWMGEATLHRVPLGRRLVEVLRLGYAPAVVELKIEGDTVGATFVVERLTDTLSTMWIRAARPSMPAANLAEFNRRKRMGIGRFVEDTVFEKHQLEDLALLLPKILPGVRATPHPDLPGRYILKSTRAGNSVRTAMAGCSVDIYLDGIQLADVLDLLKPTDVAGAELYSMDAAPAQYRRPYGACHVLLLWSRW